MKETLKHPEHLTRYFFIFGIVAFVGYTRRLHEEAFLALIGPSLYIAATAKSLINSFLELPSTQFMSYYAFLLPVCLIYFSFIGYQFKKLWNERGPIRIVVLTIFLAFIGYIHIIAYGHLLQYLQA